MTAPDVPESLPAVDLKAGEALADRINDTSAMSPEPAKAKEPEAEPELEAEPEPEPIKEPEDVTGSFKKRGHVVKNWKERHFVLSKGLLSYYIHSVSPNNLKGGIEVKNYKYEPEIPGMKNPGEGMAYFICTGEPELLVDFGDAATKKKWMDHIAEHVEYYTKKDENDVTKSVESRPSLLGAVGGLVGSVAGVVGGLVSGNKEGDTTTVTTTDTTEGAIGDSTDATPTTTSEGSNL